MAPPVAFLQSKLLAILEGVVKTLINCFDLEAILVVMLFLIGLSSWFRLFLCLIL